jgi:hypothetical protein
MPSTFVSTSGHLHVQTVMSKDQLIDALREFMLDDVSDNPDLWCQHDLLILKCAFTKVQNLLEKTSHEP